MEGESVTGPHPSGAAGVSPELEGSHAERIVDVKLVGCRVRWEWRVEDRVDSWSLSARRAEVY